MSGLLVSRGQPEVVRLLRVLPDHVLHHKGVHFRHPIGSFNVAWSRWKAGFVDALSALEEVLPNRVHPDALPEPPNMDPMLKAMTQCLRSQFEFVEDCRMICGHVFDPACEKGDKLQKRFQERAPRKHIATLVNEMKHHQGQLRWIYLFDAGLPIPGYYLESADEDHVGPNKVLHDDGATAISFSWDLRRHFINAYEVADQLMRLIIHGTKSQPEQALHSDEDVEAVAIAARLERLPHLCFLNESWVPGPRVRVMEKSGSPLLELSWVSGCHSAPLSFHIRGWWKGDGVTRAFGIPYFGDKWEQMVREHHR